MRLSRRPIKHSTWLGYLSMRESSCHGAHSHTACQSGRPIGRFTWHLFYKAKGNDLWGLAVNPYLGQPTSFQSLVGLAGKGP